MNTAGNAATSRLSSMRTLYIIYNASGTVAGKLIYGYRKLTAPSKPKSCPSPESQAAPSSSKSQSEPVCAACDITHGGLSLSETAAWTKAKKEIESLGQGIKVVQLHRNEVHEDLKSFVKSEGIRYPAVILQEHSGGGNMKLVMSHKELAECEGDADAFVQRLKQNSVIEKEQASL